MARKDYAAVTTDLKPLYQADTEDGVKRAMVAFAETRGEEIPHGGAVVA